MQVLSVWKWVQYTVNLGTEVTVLEFFDKVFKWYGSHYIKL